MSLPFHNRMAPIGSNPFRIMGFEREELAPDAKVYIAVIATATLDRLMHHCKVVKIKSHSTRFR